MIGALAYIAFDPNGPMDLFTVLPIQIFNWVSLPQKEFASLAAGGIMVLLAVLLVANLGAVIVRHKYERRNQ
jgi:phosphate transport system permease protein